MTPNSLAPAFLLSMPQLRDPNFSRTVVLLCRHSEEGAFGLVVNRPLVTTGRVVVNLEPAPAAREGATSVPAEPREQAETVATERELQVWVGGPVEPQRSWMLVGNEPDANDDARGMRIAEALYLSTSPDLLRRLLEPKPPRRTRLVVGYSGWGPGQLEAELQASAWLLSDVDSDLIFNTPPERMWEAAIRRLGADPGTLQMSRGVH
jgi:putative transcriptional regulator